MLNKVFALFFCLTIVASSCEEKVGDKLSEVVMAKVGDKELTRGFIQEHVGKLDSSHQLNIKLFVHNWVRNEVVLQEAEKALSKEEQNFERELDDYRSSLLRYSYETKMIDSSIDTVISKAQIAEYYRLNSNNFELKENFVKIRILNLKADFKERSKRKMLFNYSDSVGKQAYEDWVVKNSLISMVYDSTWVSWDRVKEIVPIKLFNEERFITQKNYREFWDGVEIWMIKITDYQLKDEVSPLEMVESKIKSILINQRKRRLIKQKEEELYMKAVGKGDVKLYIND